MSNAKEFGVNFKKKYDADMEDAVLEWMDGVMGTTVMCEGERGPDKLKEKLMDGKILCELMNKIKPGSVPKYNTKKNPIPFQKRENIEFFNIAVREYGIKPEYVFVTEDLFGGKNLNQVIIGLRELGTKASERGVTPKIRELRHKPEPSQD